MVGVTPITGRSLFDNPIICPGLRTYTYTCVCVCVDCDHTVPLTPTFNIGHLFFSSEGTHALMSFTIVTRTRSHTYSVFFFSDVLTTNGPCNHCLDRSGGGSSSETRQVLPTRIQDPIPKCTTYHTRLLHRCEEHDLPPGFSQHHPRPQKMYRGHERDLPRHLRPG